MRDESVLKGLYESAYARDAVVALRGIVRVGEEFHIGALGSGDERLRTAVCDDPAATQNNDPCEHR